MMPMTDATLPKKIGVLLTNIGTPDAPTPKALRRYLNEFLSDPFVVHLPKLLWQPMLKGIILPLRSRRSAKLYQKIWQSAGSPLLTTSKKQAIKLQSRLSTLYPETQFNVALGMNYGSPSIATALHLLKEFQPEKIIIFPLFPQYSKTTTASAFNTVKKTLLTWRNKPKIAFIDHYYNHEDYINALVNSIKKHWQDEQTQSHLLFSFHGIPKSYINPNEPYDQHCNQTAKLVARKLNLNHDEWTLAFQSRMGKKKWLGPYCIDLLEQFPTQGITSVDVICPGFSADCLETLEEISMTNQQRFIDAGGKKFHYIPSLNDTDAHINTLATIIKKHLF